MKCLWLLACVALLPSCAQWQLGEHLNDAHSTYTGLDVAHPTDGKLYRPAQATAGTAMPFYITAPEVTYKLYPHPVLRLHEELPPWLMYAQSDKVSPTGRTITARIEDDGKRGLVAVKIPALPAGLVAEDATATEGQRMLAILSEERKEPGVMRRALIGACDYLLDPLLTLISTPVYVACILVEVPFSSQGQEERPQPPDPQPVPEMPYEPPTP